MSAKIVAANALLVLCVLLLVAFFGSDRVVRSLVEEPHTLEIGGVPVYNYHLRHRTLHSTSSKRKLLDSTTDWVMVIDKKVSDEAANELCRGRKHSEQRCEVRGRGKTPSGKSVSFLSVSATVAEMSDLLVGNGNLFRYVEPDGRTYARQSSLPWGLDRIDARVGLDNGFNVSPFGGSGVHVFMLDTGIRTSHVDFGHRAVPTLEVLGNGAVACAPLNVSCANDLQGHGSHTAGTVGGALYGVAKGVTLHAVKVLNDQGSGSFSWFVDALDWVVQSGLRPAVVSASLGGLGTYQFVKEAIDAAVQDGVTVVVAAGNDNDDACKYSPASVPSAITVGATTSTDGRASYSNYGSCVDVFAPGSLVKSVGISSDTATATMSGTSMACPHVAGAAALLLEAEPTLSPLQVAQKLTEQATLSVVSNAGVGSPNIFLYVGPSAIVPTTSTTLGLSGQAQWKVTSGLCSVDSSGCALSPHWPANYGNNELCTVQVVAALAGQISVVSFDTEIGYDILTLNGKNYSGSSGPSGVTPVGFISWSSDYSIVKAGWKLCLSPPTTAPTTVTTTIFTALTTTLIMPTSTIAATTTQVGTTVTLSSASTTIGSTTKPMTTTTTDFTTTSSPGQSLPPWSVTSGPCTIDSDFCALSPYWPANYGNNEFCTIRVSAVLAAPMIVVSFATESGYDILEVNGKNYSGSSGPANVTPVGIVSWFSDYSIVKPGWKLCLSTPAGTTPSPTTAPSSTAMSSTSVATSPTTTVSVAAPSTTAPPTIAPTTSATALTTITTTHTNPMTSMPVTTVAGTTTSSTPKVTPPWSVTFGTCTIDSDFCALSPNFPNKYGNNESCSIQVAASVGPINVSSFVTELGYDVLTVNGQPYSGRVGPSGITPVGSILWRSDPSVVKSGWKLCILPVGAPPTTTTTTTTIVASTATFVSSVSPPWGVDSGPCAVDEQSCLLSPNYPSRYGNNQACIIKVDVTRPRAIQVISFDTEEGHDSILVNGLAYDGTIGPDGVVPDRDMIWVSDGSTRRPGWKLCPVAPSVESKLP